MTRDHRWGLALISLQTLAAIAVLAVILAGQLQFLGLFAITIVFNSVIMVLDLIWLMIFWHLRKLSEQTLTLLRIQPVIAWLIYHSAALPLFLLTDRFAKIPAGSWLMIQIALLVMGMIPVVSMLWLDRYLKRRI